MGGRRSLMTLGIPEEVSTAAMVGDAVGEAEG